MCGSHSEAWRRWCGGALLVTLPVIYLEFQGTLYQHGHHSILQQYAIPSGLGLVGLSFVFQQDNDPKHTSRLCKGYLTNKESDGVLVERMPRVYKAVIKAKGGYFEESIIYFV